MSKSVGQSWFSWFRIKTWITIKERFTKHLDGHRQLCRKVANGAYQVATGKAYRAQQRSNDGNGIMSEAEFPRESEQDKIVKRLIKVAKEVASRASIANDEDDELVGAFDQAIEDAELLFEDTSPRGMGWVGCDGLP
jgi:hypothetical protein